MREFQVTTIYKLTDLIDELDRDTIVRIQTEYTEELSNESGVTVDDIRVDVIPLRGQQQMMETGGLFPPMNITHPWDQGSWIFPDDHPLAGYERAAKMNQDQNPAVKEAFLEAGMKMLPPAKEDE